MDVALCSRSGFGCVAGRSAVGECGSEARDATVTGSQNSSRVRINAPASGFATLDTGRV